MIPHIGKIDLPYAVDTEANFIWSASRDFHQ